MSNDNEQVLDVDKILNSPPTIFTATYNQRDLLIYALGIGETSTQFTNENDPNFAVHPLYPVVFPFKGDSQDVVPYPPPRLASFPDGMPPVNPAMILHGEQSLELFEPLDPNGDTLTCTSRIVSVLDKGKGTTMESETTVTNKDNKVIARLVSTSFIRGLTGFKGKGRKSSPMIKIPKDQPPSVLMEQKLVKNQAQFYRLSGDYNMLHIDPVLSEMVGFKTPILHGLCGLGIATSALYKSFCGGQVERFRSVRARFVSPVFPYAEETLQTMMWKVSKGKVVFRVIVKERNKVVLDAGVFTFDEEEEHSRL